MGLAPIMLPIAYLVTVRNQRILTAFQTRQDDSARRAASGQPPRTRKRRRALTATTPAPP